MINPLTSVPVVGTQHLSYLFAYNLDGHHCQYISGSPQFNGEHTITLRNKKGKKLVFTRQRIGQDHSRSGQYNCPSKNSHFPAGIRFSQEEFCRSSGEHRLQAKSIRESCSLIARENIAVPNPSSEGAMSVFLQGSGSFCRHKKRKGNWFLSICSGLHHCRKKHKHIIFASQRSSHRERGECRKGYLGKGGMLKYFLDIYVPPIVPVVVTSKACSFARYRVVGMSNGMSTSVMLTNSIVLYI